MNEVSIIEHLNGGSSLKITSFQESDFIGKLESYCYNEFDQDNEVKSFAFILNNNENNYFAELLSNDEFIKSFTTLLSTKLTAIWCEPQIESSKEDEKNYEHFVQAQGIDPKKIWSKLSHKLYPDQTESLESNNNFPCILIIKVKKIQENYIIEDAILHKLKSYEEFDNILEFKAKFTQLFEAIIENLGLQDDGTLTENLDEYVKIVKQTVVKEITRTIIDKAREIDISSIFESLKELLSEFADNINPTDFL